MSNVSDITARYIDEALRHISKRFALVLLLSYYCICLSLAAYVSAGKIQNGNLLVINVQDAWATETSCIYRIFEESFSNIFSGNSPLLKWGSLWVCLTAIILTCTARAISTSMGERIYKCIMRPNSGTTKMIIDTYSAGLGHRIDPAIDAGVITELSANLEERRFTVSMLHFVCETALVIAVLALLSGFVWSKLDWVFCVIASLVAGVSNFLAVKAFISRVLCRQAYITGLRGHPVSSVFSTGM